VQLALGLNAFISGQGNARIAMLSVVIGAAINIVLDPIFIFVCGMGVRGAALATILSQAVSAGWVVHFLTSDKSVIRIRRKNIRLDPEMIKYIASLGISPFIMQSTEGFVLITLNSSLKTYGGDLYVGSMSIMTSVMQLLVVPIQGFNQGVQPIISYNFGAGKKDRVLGTFRRMLCVSLSASLILAGTAVFFPQIFSRMFTDNEALLAITNRVMPVYFLGMMIFGIQMSCQSTFIALKQAKISLFIALLRKVILLIPLALILPHFFGVMGVYYAEPAADMISVATTAVLFAVTIKKIR
jgi:putative MATE family efflux protein